MTLVAGVLVALGFCGLAFGADWLVEGASGLARRFRVSPLVIGLTVVAYGTSAPEIGANLVAVLRDSPGLAVGNVIGSNASNLGLILGITAVAHPFAVPPALLRREFVFMFAATCLLWPFAAAGVISRGVGLASVLILVAFNLLSIRWSRRAEAARDADPGGETAPPLAQSLGRTAFGLAALIVGADLLVRGATDIARGFGVTETTIGFTLVALGSSLPEFAASLAAAGRGQIQIAAGNVIGSNLFNVLGALGLSALVVPISLESDLLSAEIPGILALTLLAGVFLLTGRRLSRIEGIVLIAAYGAYVAFVLL